MKRIMLVSPFPPYIGGVSVSAQRLYEHLATEGYEVKRFNTQLKNKRLNLKPLKFLRYFFLPVFLLFHRRYDVIHFHVSKIFPKYYVSLWRPLFARETKFIITIHGQVRNAYKTKMGYKALKGFDRIICVKKGDRKNMPAELVSRTVEIPAFIPPVIEKEYHANLPLGLERFLSSENFKMLLNGFIILNGPYHDLYGFRDAIVLLDKLREREKVADLILIVLGKDNTREAASYLADLKKFISNRKLEDHVFWIEESKMELWPLLKRVNVLLRPTKTDGDALSVRESLFLKVPVITSNAVTRPAGAIVYKLKSPDDFLNKTISLMDNYDNFVSCINTAGKNVNFAYKIIEQYENN